MWCTSWWWRLWSTKTLPRSATRMKTPVTPGGHVPSGSAQQRRSYGSLTSHTGQWSGSYRVNTGQVPTPPDTARLTWPGLVTTSQPGPCPAHLSYSGPVWHMTTPVAVWPVTVCFYRALAIAGNCNNLLGENLSVQVVNEEEVTDIPYDVLVNNWWQLYRESWICRVEVSRRSPQTVNTN